MKKLSLISLIPTLILPSAVFAQEVCEDGIDNNEDGRVDCNDPICEGTEACEESPWYDDLSVDAFVDAFYMVDWNRPEIQNATSGVKHRAYDYTNGFSLAFVGLDASYEGENVGATINLRFGPGTERLIIGGGNPVDTGIGLQNLKQGYVSWMPTEGLQLDLGTFDTIYGAEVSESWMNLNYTRGALYYLMQPFYHTGLRITYESDKIPFTIKGLLVNGYNNTVDNNESPYGGVQFGFTPSDDMSLAVGYLFGAQANTNKNFEHFIDVVFNMSAGGFNLVFNGDFGAKDLGNEYETYFGLSLAGGYKFIDTFGLAARVEYLSDQENLFSTGYEDLVTGTITLDYQPLNNLIIRLDNRLEWANNDVFPSDEDPTGVWFATTLGVVVNTGY